MKTALFDYSLPEALIARHPPLERDGARLLVLNETSVEHANVQALAERIPAGALLVLNVTKVRRARLLGQRKDTQGRVEVLLLERLGGEGTLSRWSALGRANKALRAGQQIELVGAEVSIERVLPDGLLEVALHSELEAEAYLAQQGHVPLPPYLGRADEAADKERYQTVYAQELGSVAAPTAGLHLTQPLLERLKRRGVEIGEVTLHVGLGTFRPVGSDDLDDHVMHAERFTLSEALSAQLARARERRAPVVAVGTTVVRTLESCADPERPGHVLAAQGQTRLFIQPGYRFQVVDALLTNFHQPRSTLLALVAAFAGRERLFAAYAEAIAQGYRFLSYGDAMWIPRRIGC